MAQITTKSGDGGMTQLAPGRMASKTHPCIDIMGNIDELSCILGMDGDRFDAIQTYLSELMGYFYFQHIDTTRLKGQVDFMEEYITNHNNSIPPPLCQSARRHFFGAGGLSARGTVDRRLGGIGKKSDRRRTLFKPGPPDTIF